jgi:Uma2 family endonuclease
MNAMVDPMLDPALLAPERVRPLKRREFEKLVELGEFRHENVELLRGVLVTMSPQGEPHARISAWFAQHLIKALDLRRYETRTHSSFPATSDSMPEPDVSVSVRRGDFQRPDPSNSILLIEVAQSSLTKDRVIKNEIYARSGVPEYWVVNVKTRTVEVRRGPTKAGYQRVVVKRAGDTLRPLKLRGVTFDVADIPWPRDGEDEGASGRKPKRRR